MTLFEEADRIAAGPVRYASAEHFALIQYAADECARLGLEFAFHNGPGWSSSGGPWITPEQAMKHVTWSETRVVGPTAGSLVLPLPPTMVEEYRSRGHTYQDHDFYRDVVVVAFPTPDDPEVRLDDWQSKAGFVVPVAYGIQEQAAAVPSGGVVPLGDIRVLEQSVNEHGELIWQVPPGDWTVLRVGYMLTGHVNQQGPTTGGRGLDCDKLNRAAVDFHWEKFVERVVGSARANGSDALSTVLIDSYETDAQTWTEAMPAEFERLRGYSLLPYLPCLTGRVVDSVTKTERFLWDFRRTIAELVEENYYGHFAKRCREAGLLLALEGYGYNAIFDDFDVSRRADVPMGEFWAGIFKYSHWAVKVAASASDLNDNHVVGAEAFTSGGGDAAWKWHPYRLKAQGDYYLSQGVTRFYIQASAHQPWADHIRPGMTMGPHGIQMNRNNTWWEPSRAWLAYLGRVQSMLQQGDLVADICYYYGENEPATLRTRPNAARDRLGVPWDPDGDKRANIWFELPEGHDFHVVSRKVLEEFSVDAQGRIVHPSGTAYEVLVLPDDPRMRVETLKTLAALVHQGATVLGPRPVSSPSLEDGAAGDERVRALADQLWGRSEEGQGLTRHRYGRGWVFAGQSLESVLQQRAVPRDFSYAALGDVDALPPRLVHQHRTTPEADFYFVSNQRNAPAAVTVTFRQSGRVPEIWNPETGRRAPAAQWQAAADGRTEVVLRLDPAESCFVVFDAEAAAGDLAFVAFEHEGTPVVDRATARLEIAPEGPRLVAFAPGDYRVRDSRGGQVELRHRTPGPSRDLDTGWGIEFPLAGGQSVTVEDAGPGSWTELSDDRLRHFSGTATYSREVVLDAADLVAGNVVEIDFGHVEIMAELTVNGHDLGVLWKPPFRRDLTDVLVVGRNRITLKVTNLWRNRLIGDAAIRQRFGDAEPVRISAKVYPVPDWVRTGEDSPDGRLLSFTTSPFYRGAEELVDSGLLGPVRLVFGHRYSLRHH